MFRIGEFSRLVQLSVRVLRHYDEIGLLPPAHTDPSNGYRYYAATQLADVSKIIALKDLGLSLEQVQKLVREDVSTAELTGILRVEVARAEQARAAAERRLRDLERRLAEIKDSGGLSDIDIVEKAVPAIAYLAYRSTVADMAAATALMDEVLALGTRIRPSGPLIIVGHDTFFDTENLDIELGYPAAQPPSVDLGRRRWMVVGRLPAVERMLSVMHVGDHEDGHRRCHHAIGLWLERNGCHLAGPGREIVHRPGGVGDPPTVEIQYPVAAG